jgi:hypothetical protein
MKRLNRSVLGPVTDYYVGYLRQIEAGLYDGQETLCEERLAELTSLPIPRPIDNQVNSDAYQLATMLCVTPGLVRYGLRRLRLKLSRRAVAPAAE